jgi:hypothetical protein
MSKCPFWSTTREKVECYRECPICESSEGKDVDQCIFNDCTEARNANFADIIKEDYSFLNLSIYDEEVAMNIKY